MKPNRLHVLTLFLLFVSLSAVLTMGALKRQRAFITRGLPDSLPEPVREGGTRLGINVYLSAYDTAKLEAVLAEIAEMGISYVKQPFYFQESYDWAESDRLVSAVSRHNLMLVPLLDGNPANQFAPPNNPTHFANWAAEFARRYGDQIRYYIIWDEPNLTTHWGNQPVNPLEYAALLTATAEAIRAADSDAVIVAAPLAPTVEEGPQNLADSLYLQELYQAGAAEAFDVVAAKPYGFNTAPDDRRVDMDVLNFSRVILLREVMLANGDGATAVWAGNWGWNSLPANWQGAPSIWGETDETTRANWTIAALERARREWPWMGVMFLENWEPDAAENDPHWGFSIAGRETAVALREWLIQQNPAIAWPGFHLARPDDAAQQFSGGWRFSPEFGADISQSGDRVRFTFWGTDIGLRVRRADFRARLYITVDGQPANALPSDENGTTLVLTSPNKFDDYIATELVARNLSPGIHTLELVASRGWDQWALQGFSVGYRPPDGRYRLAQAGLAILAASTLAMAYYTGRQTSWGAVGKAWSSWFHTLSAGTQWGITTITAVIVALSGWLTWGQQAAGMYRRLGDSTQFILTATAATIFYVTPSFYVYLIALLCLFCLIYFRPVWGLVLIAFCFSFYVPPLPKPIGGYRFSPPEVFTLVTLAATLLSWFSAWRAGQWQRRRPNWHPADWSVLLFVAVVTLTLPFTERLDVATNEWRVVILEPAIFYLLLRFIRPSDREMWWVLDAFVAGGLVVALYGLWQYGFDRDSLITAEGGILRLRAFYGSPNNVALFLGRVWPLLTAMLWLGSPANGRRRWLYGMAFVPVSLAILLTFSKGALFLGLPVAALFIFWHWQREGGRRTWPWVVGTAVLGLLALLILLQIPQLSARLDIRGTTGFFRLNLWQASLNMVREHPVFGVGLDNFLYAYRGRYILDAAWQEPNLNHPHNVLLDFATRIGLAGLLAGGWMIWQAARLLWWHKTAVPRTWLPVTVGLGGALADMLAHGLVDHSFFLVDLAFTFYLILGTAVWLTSSHTTQNISIQ